MIVHGKALATIVEGENDDLKYGPHGGFTAVLSTPSTDRDGDSLLREEWQDLPEHCTLDMDHGMSVATTVGSFTPYWGDDGSLMMRAAFSSIERAQEARTLVREGHVRDVSVAFMTDKTKKSGEPRRELLNAGIVAIGSNRDSKILDSKALDTRAEEIIAERCAETDQSDTEEHTKALHPYGHVTYADPEDGKYPIDTVAHIRAALAYINVQRNYDALGDHAAHVKRAIEAAARAHGIHVADDKSVEDATVKAPRGNGDGPALTQAIHDASVHLGALCYPLVSGPEDPTGAAEGANKTVSAETEETPEAETKDEDIPDDSPLGRWLGAFEKRLTEVLIGDESPAESPAEAASDEEPAVKAADDAAEDVTALAEVMRMRLALYNK